MTQTQDSDKRLEPELMAYIDGSLPPDRAAEVEAMLARDPEAREAVAQQRHFDNLLRDYAGAADGQSENLKTAALERKLAGKLKTRKWRAALWGPMPRRMVAGLVLFVAGWGGHAYYSHTVHETMTAHPSFIGPSLAGHLTYALTQQNQVEFPGDQMQAALAWMSDQMQQKIDSPKLERVGYEVQSARLMMVDEQPVAVFYYTNPEGEQATVSITPRTFSQPHYSLRVADIANYKTAYWSSDALHYAVIADGLSIPITTLAAAVQD